MNFFHKLRSFYVSFFLKNVKKLFSALWHFHHTWDDVKHIKSTLGTLPDGVPNYFEMIFHMRFRDRFQHCDQYPPITHFMNQRGLKIALGIDPSVVPYFRHFFHEPEIFYPESSNKWRTADIAVIWGVQPTPTQLKLLVHAADTGMPLFLGEEGLIKSVHTWAASDVDLRWRSSVSLLFDDMAPYFDGTLPSRLELWLNSDEDIPQPEIERSRNLIDFIVKNQLSKYNHQPIYSPAFGHPGKKKVLVVDQSFGDLSIKRGCADEMSFDFMLNSAIQENSNADILVKTHPDTLVGKSCGRASGYFSGIEKEGSVIPITDAINPISLINAVDRVYVVSSHLGFEALMCGKKVSVFGMPYYAGWGLTDDRIRCYRRHRKRSLEEIFAFVYLRYLHYINPARQTRCEPEEAMEWLLKEREMYFKEFDIRCG